MSLRVEIRHGLGTFQVDVGFETSGRLTALFGRSGAGKTTVVNAIAGLIRPNRARISVDDKVFVDTEAGIFVPKHRRRIGYVFQEGRLFPHLTIRQNLHYGRWFSSKRSDAREMDEIIELLGIGKLLARRPGDLSGGEKQRVAIGRALLADPQLLLMDEPLASLDDERKAEILPYIERLRDEVKVPIVYVSHAVSEIARLATMVVVMAEGRVEAVGPVADVLSRPQLRWQDDEREAGGILTVRVVGHDDRDGLTTLSARSGTIVVPHVDATVGSELRIHVRARDIMLAADKPQGLSALNVLPARIVEIGAASGPVVDVALDLEGDRLLARITRRSLETMQLARGRSIFAVLKSIAIEQRDVGYAFGDGLDGDSRSNVRKPARRA
jgi:molybdate transport system ATP-binding protein